MKLNIPLIACNQDASSSTIKKIVLNNTYLGISLGF